MEGMGNGDGVLDQSIQQQPPPLAGNDFRPPSHPLLVGGREGDGWRTDTGDFRLDKFFNVRRVSAVRKFRLDLV